MKFFMPALSAVLVALLVACATTQTTDQNVSSANTKGLNIQSWQTSKGSKVLYVHAPELPMVDISVVFDAGSARDGKLPGLAMLTNGMLAHGAGKLNVEQIAERFDATGANFGSDVQRDMAEISLRSLTDDKWLSVAVDTFRTVLSKPTFPKSELERVRKQVMVAFAERKQSPGSIVDELFYQNLYKQHPYASPVSGTEKSVNRISRKDLVDFYQRYYVARNAMLTIVGAVDRRQAETLAEKLMAQIPAGSKATAIQDAKQLSSAHNIHHEHPSTQTHIMMGHQSLDRHDPDYFVLYVGNHILGGGGFGSRIMEEIREKRGLAYSSYSYFYPLRNKGPFLVGMQTSNAQTKQALQVLHATLDTFIKEGPSQQELEHAKKNITGGFPLRIDSNSDVSNYLALIGFYDLPLDYLSTFNSRVEAVTLDQIREVFQRRVHPDKMLTVTVGKAKG